MRAVSYFLMILAAATPLSSPAFAKNKGVAKQKQILDSQLNCKQLTGRMQIRIVEVRTYDPSKQSSAFSRGLQSVFVNTVGTQANGVDPDGEHAADLKQLHDYNQRLVELGCRSYDLDKELARKGDTTPPAATIPAPKSKSVSKAAPVVKQP